MLGDWHDFYILVGTASAALVALLFVAATVGVGVISAERSAGTRLYMSPVVVHFTAVLLTCAVGLVPSQTALSLTLIIGAGAAIGFFYATALSVRVLKDPNVDFDDKLCHGIAPPVGYAMGVGSALLFHLNSPHAAALLATALLLLLVANIRNAWDLVIFMTRQQTAARKSENS